MAKGRPADPTRTRRATGNRPMPGEAKPSKALAVVPAASGMPEPPAGLEPAAEGLWRATMAELGSRGLREADLAAVEMMVVAYQRNREAREKIAETGMLVRGPRGPMVNPLLKVEKDTAATYLRLAEQFGLTLAARLRLGLMQLAGESLLQSLNADLDR
jgi:P27 family predicted phage terminase small subunit